MDKIYKIRHPSGLYYKGMGMQKANNSRTYIKYKGEYIPLDRHNKEMALHLCFNKSGKAYASLGRARAAIKYGHEPALDNLFKECEIKEFSLAVLD